MHDVVLQAFPGFSQKLEGRTNYMYLDKDGKVTTAIGCLVDPLELALELPWKLRDGALASREEVSAQWHDLRAQTRLAVLGAQYAATVTTLRLTDADVDALVRERLMRHEAILSQTFLGWAFFPADAQLAIHSLAWALGVVGFLKEFPKFTRAANAQDWATALAECTIKGETSNKGLIPRNVANRICLANARVVRADIEHAGRARGTHLYTSSQLYWPKALTLSPSPVA